MRYAFVFLLAIFLSAMSSQPAVARAEIETDLLIVGGSESACAAAVQAARMGVRRIVLVNDTRWLGGQFSAEAVGAIDENRGHGYDGTVPIPRSGIFAEVISAIETENTRRYGVPRPGNTRVITTARPVVAETVFRNLLKPYEERGTIRRFSDYHVQSVDTVDERVVSVTFQSNGGEHALIVRAAITIDASDWGDVIQHSGAAWDYGLDAQSEFGEPSAPTSGEPPTDVNPITWCMILVATEDESLIEQPPEYDERYFNGQWGWIDESFAYTSRRLVDGAGLDTTNHPDVVLINTPPIDYPLDVFSAEVAHALEASQNGSATTPFAALNRAQKDIVFRDARRHSLKFFYYLQQRFPKFRRMRLSDEFGTEDHLPPKPYVRESLRLRAQHIIREQEVLGFESRSHYASTMFPDAVFSWQFELDFHPTRREWTTDRGAEGPWQAVFRGNRRFGRGGTGRCVFPLRSLIPERIGGLLGAQKNLGYTSIVSSSCRLHDQSIHVGQASGAVAAVSLRSGVEASGFLMRRDLLEAVWDGLLGAGSDGETFTPLVIWPFADVSPADAGCRAIQHLALRRLLNLNAADTHFYPDQVAEKQWVVETIGRTGEAGYHIGIDWKVGSSRRDVAVAIWNEIKGQPAPAWQRRSENDADEDNIPDSEDPLPFTPGRVSWQANPDLDGKPNLEPPFDRTVFAWNFTTASGPKLSGYRRDFGQQFTSQRGYGWTRDLTKNNRIRHVDRHTPRDDFVFTRNEDTWRCQLENGRYRILGCLGDSAHDQPNQNVVIDSVSVASNTSTVAGKHFEFEYETLVENKSLSITIGKPNGGSNTCLNWLMIVPLD